MSARRERLLPTRPHAFARQGLPRLPPDPVTQGRKSRRHPAGRRSASSLRTSRCLIRTKFRLTNGSVAAGTRSSEDLWIGGFSISIRGRPVPHPRSSSLPVGTRASRLPIAQLSRSVTHLVADQLAAAAGENRRVFDKACPVLLVAAGRESSDAPGLRKHAAEDRDAAAASGIRRGAERSRFR